MSNESFIKKNKNDKYITMISIPLLIIVIFLFGLSNLRHNITIYNIISEVILIILVVLLIYLGGLGRIFSHKVLKIYDNGIVPSNNPFWDLTMKDVFIPYNEITQITYDKHPHNSNLYVFRIHTENGKIFKVNSKWFYQYKLSTSEIKRIKRYLIEIKKGLEKEENIKKRKESKNIILFDSNSNI